MKRKEEIRTGRRCKQVKDPGISEDFRDERKGIKGSVRKREVMKMQAVRLFVCAVVGVFGAPAGGGEGTWFSPVVPAGAPVPTWNWLKLAHSLTHLLYIK